ncbi:RecA-like DNA recombinase [Microbacterium phage Triscuit]|nr:RecA-like DNA recombinase [Microbacterium phage Triscuit]
MAKLDYAALAAKHITRPKDATRYPKFLIYGRNKKGKSTFALSGGIENTLVLDPEDGTDEMRSSNPHVWKITRWEDLDDVVNYLKYAEHQYKWVSVDGLTRYANMALKYVMRVQEERSLDRQPGMVQLKDYGKAGELMKDFLTRLHNLPLGVIFTAQERMVEASDSEEDEDAGGEDALFIPDLPKGVRSYVNSIVDVIGRIYVVKNEETEQYERRLWIGESLKYDTGYRSDFPLPQYLAKPTAPRLTRLIRTGSPNVPKATTQKAPARTK